MSKRARSSRLELELRLNLSPPRAANSSSADKSSELLISSSSSSSSSLSSAYSLDGSCLSSEAAETRAMLLVGCFRCLMYVMLSQVDPNPKCPKCKSTVLLDFSNIEENNKKASS